MTDTETLSTLINRLDLPTAELSALSFCNSSRAAAVIAWGKKLPVTQINSTAALLYQAVREIARLNTTPLNHLEILENLRPYVQQNIQSLSKQFLGQPLILPESAMKTAIIAQALQRHMNVSYCLVVQGLLRLRPKGNFKSAEKKALGLALHRAVNGIGLQFMRSTQIYTQPPPNMWLELNSLYQIADQIDALKTTYSDPLLQHLPAASLEHAYMRIALLACARPNQLNQQEVNTLYDLLDSWSRLTQLVPLGTNYGNNENVYFVDFEQNTPPAYKSSGGSMSSHSLELQFSTLLNAIRKQQDDAGEAKEIINIPPNISSHLLNHLLKSWGQEVVRSSPRRPNSSFLEIAVGLSSIHYNLLGRVSFQNFVHSSGKPDKFKSEDCNYDNSDPWDNAFDSEGLGRSNYELGLSLDLPGKALPESSETAEKTEPYPLYKVQILDSSKDGYRLDWRGEIPAQTKTGELISLHQPGQGYHIGVIRWARQHRNGAQIGIQIVALHVKPCAAQQLVKMGDNNVYMHALLVSDTANRPHYTSIITAIHPFREKQKINIMEDNQTYSALLTKLELSTACVSLFRFRHQETAASASAKNTAKPANDFQSDW